VLNAVGDEGVPVREIAEAIGRHLNLPARSQPAEEFGGMPRGGAVVTTAIWSGCLADGVIAA
jgi:hypothetical protein